eukprot:SAG25_NODE_421_length_8214_cov_3.048429_7_plen_189_part_00
MGPRCRCTAHCAAQQRRSTGVFCRVSAERVQPACRERDGRCPWGHDHQQRCPCAVYRPRCRWDDDHWPAFAGQTIWLFSPMFRLVLRLVLRLVPTPISTCNDGMHPWSPPPQPRTLTAGIAAVRRAPRRAAQSSSRRRRRAQPNHSCDPLLGPPCLDANPAHAEADRLNVLDIRTYGPNFCHHRIPAA